MKIRHQAREVALQVLYHCDLLGSLDYRDPPDSEVHFEHFKVPPSLRPFAKELISGTIENLKSIDDLIENESAHWKLNRMPPIDRNLLRMSVYELQFKCDIPVSVAIDEAVELAKSFGTAESPAFINGILDAIAKKIRQNPVPSLK